MKRMSPAHSVRGREAEESSTPSRDVARRSARRPPDLRVRNVTSSQPHRHPPPSLFILQLFLFPSNQTPPSPSFLPFYFLAMASSSSSSSSRILLLLLLLALSIVVASSAAVSRPGARIGVPDVGSNEEVQNLGLFCVEEFNRRRRAGGKLLTFSRVAAAQSQVVSGVIYYLKIAARDDRDRFFDAVVVDKPWINYRRLVSFCPSPLRPVSARH